jgi:hypothetical protein
VYYWVKGKVKRHQQIEDIEINIDGRKPQSILFNVMSIVHVNGVRLCPWTAASNGAIVHPLDDIWAWKATVEWHWQGKAEELGEKPVPLSLCPPQILHVLTYLQTWNLAVRDQWLTTWTMAQPFIQLNQWAVRTERLRRSISSSQIKFAMNGTWHLSLISVTVNISSTFCCICFMKIKLYWFTLRKFALI